jgi:hypothetical protein
MSITGAFSAAWESPSFYVGELEANADYSGISTNPSKQYFAVTVIPASGTGVVGPAAVSLQTTSGGAIMGILQNNPQLAEAAQVMVHGVSKAVIGASITSIGTILACNNAGQLIVAASGNFGVGMSFQAGVSSGQIIPVLLYGFGKQ